MNKCIKVTLWVIGIIFIFFVIDLLCIFTINRPLFAIQIDEDYIYKGIFYDTYNCEEYSAPQIKSKKAKFSCSTVKTNIGKIVNIIDTSKDIKDFTCDEALESFYEDEDYTYYFNCIKSKYVIVKYRSGYQEEVKEALKYKTITINDLDNHNIEYIKYAKVYE